ncbi:MAG: cyclase family protein [Rhodovibrionaceae bacterium]|nr:cyclase family protein [Rhodovibrionaceae bacterium]
MSVALFASAPFVFLSSGISFADTFLVDLTHPMGTYAPQADNPLEPDLNQPLGDSIAYPTFGKQTVYDTGNYFPIDRGEFYGGKVVLWDHHGTHMDAPAHFVNTPESTEPGNPEQKYLHELSAAELIGPAVVIDIGSRVAAELDKNGGKPSPDTSVTDFSDDSNNVITADDVAAVEDQIEDGVWIVANTGWSQFYFDPNWDTTPYLNGWNFPGFNNAAVDKLIEIEDKKGVRINGIVIDNIGVDTGEASRGTGEKWVGSWHSHVRGLQRSWKFVENATNLGEVAMASGGCTIVVGAPKNVMGGGGPSRIFAMCEE